MQDVISTKTISIKGSSFDSVLWFMCRLMDKLVIIHQTTDKPLLTMMFCSLAFLDPRVRHTMDVLSPFISILCHSD